MRTLVAHHDERVRTLLLGFLAELGHETCSAPTLDEAIRHAQTQSFDFVLFGFADDEAHARAFLDQCRAPRRAKVLLLLHHCNPRMVHRLFKKGIRGYIAAPFDRDDVYRHILFHSGTGSAPASAPARV